MNPMTYLCFTLMSILIQFCLMDITSIGSKIGSVIDMNRTHKKGNSNDMIKRITQRPHALYYRTEALETKTANVKSMYPNSSITDAFTTTDLISTELDLFYEDNTTVDGGFTTEPFLSSTEFDNVTEITFLYKTSTSKPLKEEKTTRKQEKCPCDLLYRMCDINCCCDFDCTDKEKLFFKICDGRSGVTNTQLRSITNNECSNSFIDNMFCIVKTNLPDQKDAYSKADASEINKVYKWHNIEKLEPSTAANKKVYSTGDPVLVLKDGNLQNIDLPIPSTNKYCKGKKPVRFLINESIKCNVKLKDLHAVRALKIANETNVVTYKNDNNSTNLNCSTLLCANWSLFVCDSEDCHSYNQEIHDPVCSETSCSNIPHKIEYIFHCNETGIIRSTVRLHVKEVLTMLQLVEQHIYVGFYMTNNSNRIIQYSGNPGYIHGLPVIASNVESNHTQHFYNNTEEDSNHILLPYNENGVCVLNGMTNNKIEFGRNKRLNCRLMLTRTKFKNATDACTKIQERIYNFLRLNGEVFISPFGKPVGEDWVLLEKFKNFIYGEAKDHKLLCRNIVTAISFTIVYVDSGKTAKENKIISASVAGSPKNWTLYNEQSSVVLSVDVRFVDASGPAMRVYAGAPVLSLHLPKNFFLPFH